MKRIIQLQLLPCITKKKNTSRAKGIKWNKNKKNQVTKPARITKDTQLKIHISLKKEIHSLRIFFWLKSQPTRNEHYHADHGSGT